MRFTRLRLNGFKSFVDPTELVITDGLTGVVGPNGCGKSNLLEALRWVMGENRPSAMRGGGMEDVIFAGAASRPARNFAEVALQLDNGDRLAPAAFNDSDLLDITRRITRDVGSAYKINSKDLRARDVQMLFADASTGAHSPALVRQGQISELINARPKARRKILEDAAGIGGLYQRRHEAELKLKGTEANLERVQDVVEQLANQLRDLARQAKQAQRYRAIGTDLRRAEGLLLYLRWRDADAAHSAAEVALTERLAAAGLAERAATAASSAREEAEDALPPLREEEAIAAAVLQRLAAEKSALAEREAQARAAVTALEGRIAQLTRDREREGALNHDAGETLARLDAEAADLDAASQGQDEALAIADQAAKEAAQELADRESQAGTLAEDVARLSARHHSARRLVEDHTRTRDRARGEADRARAAVAAAQAAVTDAEDAAAAAAEAQDAAGALAARAEAALIATDQARNDVQGREAEARAARSEAEGELGALRAEAGALQKLVARDTDEGGQIMDALTVEAGYEKALGAALADDLRAPEVADEAASGWVNLPDYNEVQRLPQGVRPLTQLVDIPAVLARRMAQVGVVSAADGAQLQAALKPGQRLVSIEGDLWRWDGFRAGAADAPTAAALRLQQLNRLELLKKQISQAEARAQGAAQAHDKLTADLARLTEADAEARRARREADQRLADSSRAASRAEADRDIAAGKLESQRMAVARHQDEAMEAEMRLGEAAAAERALPDLEAARVAADAQKVQVEAARIAMMTARAAQDELRRDGEARMRRLAAIAKDQTSWRNRLENAGKRVSELDSRQADLERQLVEARDAPGALAADQERLADQLDQAEERRRIAADTLSAGETAQRTTAQAERAAVEAAGNAREARAAAEARAEAAREAVARAAERIGEEMETSPRDLLEGLDADPAKLGDVPAIEADVARLRRQRDALGAVNLRAEEDARSVQEEHDLLVTEKADLEEAIRALRGGIAGLNREGRERLLTAFEQVNTNFARLFTHLFNGGEARLELVESDDPLEAGLEILCQPPGKKLSVLSLLSGGEQTLTALALIFGVFLANPAPICVLDEVDAPLDDANVTRFCDLLDEMTRSTETRFLIITHHAVTMSRMDRLFGVTMQEQGVSQLVSVDLKKAAQMVA